MEPIYRPPAFRDPLYDYDGACVYISCSHESTSPIRKWEKKPGTKGGKAAAKGSDIKRHGRRRTFDHVSGNKLKSLPSFREYFYKYFLNSVTLHQMIKDLYSKLPEFGLPALCCSHFSHFRIHWAPISSSLSPYGWVYISPSHIINSAFSPESLWLHVS